MVNNDEMNQLLRGLRDRPSPRLQVVVENGRGKVVPAASETADKRDDKGANDDKQGKHSD